MTTSGQEWLPLGAVMREPLRAKITAAVAAWADAWFSPERRLHTTRWAIMRTGDTVGGQAGSWKIPCQGLAISCPARAANRLLDWALDADVQSLSTSDIDRKLIEAFEAQLFEDLATRLEQALEIKSPPRRNAASPYGPFGGLSVEIADEHGDTLIWLGLAIGDLLPACRALLPPRPRDAEKLTGLSSALADTRVPIDAILGSATIGLADLETLAPGDVLVLDTSLEAAARLFLTDSQREVGRARLIHTEDALSLTVQV